MPLSEHEQRILDEIERRLAAEDPKFARSTAVATPRSVALRRRNRAVGGFVAGLVLLIAGLVTGLDDANLLFVFGLAGFAVMLVSVMLIVRAVREIGPGGDDRKRTSWFDRMEDRWRKRFDDGEERR